MSYLRFGSAGAVTPEVTRHPLFGRLAITIWGGPVYDAVTGAEVTEEDLLADPFHYRGTLEAVPSEVLAWTFCAEAEIEAAWQGISGSATVEAGYRMEDVGEGLVRVPEADADRVSVWLPGNASGNPADLTYPQPSVWTLAEPRASLGDTDKLRVRVVGSLGSGAGSQLKVLAIDPGTPSFGSVDTGIYVSEEAEEAYQLHWERLSGYGTKLLEAGYNYLPAYYTRHGVWAAPFGVAGSRTIGTRETTVIKDGTYETLYLDPGNAAILDAAEESLKADDDVEYLVAERVGRGRFVIAPPSPLSGASWAAPADVSARPTKQLPRFLEFEKFNPVP